MKMNYRLRNNSKFKNKNLRFKIITLVIAFFITLSVFFSGIFSGFLNKIALPFWRVDIYVVQKFSEIFAIINSKKSLILENRRLSEELNKNMMDTLMLRVIQKENQDLKALLGRDKVNKNTVIGAVLAKPGISPFDVIIIDIGLDEGVKKGNKVFYEKSVAIGEVEEVYERSSKIKLYSSPGEKFLTFVGENNIQVEAEGLGGGNFFAVLPRDAEVKEGDIAIVPGASTLVLGFVHKIKLNPTDAFQNIIFKTPVNLSELKWVLVEI